MEVQGLRLEPLLAHDALELLERDADAVPRGARG